MNPRPSGARRKAAAEIGGGKNMGSAFRVKAWLLASRPKTLPAAIAPVAVGSACAAAEGRFAPVHALFALLFALLVQITCNLANDLGDFTRGADTPARLGPARMAATGALSPGELRGAIALLAGLAFLVGLPLAVASGWGLVPVGVLCIAACLAYTGGPFPLAYNGLGDVFVLVFFGFVAVLFTAFVQCGAFPFSAWAGGLACGLLAVNILLVNNARDMETDAAANKRTTVVRFGRRFARVLYPVNFSVAAGVPVLLFAAGGFRAWVLLPLAVVPLAAALSAGFWRVREPVHYNAFLGRTAGVLLLYAVLLAGGIGIGGR
jgi:1,4-dihydroxy-2-naphthoate octaprenyltransferase